MKVKPINPLMKLIYIPFGILFAFLRKSYIVFMNSYYHRKYHLDKSVRIGYECLLYGNISIGENTYLQRNCSITGKVSIGKDCSIASGVNIRAMIHKKWEGYDKEISKEIIIGNNVWIGANAFIREGVNIGDNTIIGTGAIITKNIPANSVAIGVNIIK